MGDDTKGGGEKRRGKRKKEEADKEGRMTESSEEDRGRRGKG